MGSCASCDLTTKGERRVMGNWSSTVKVIDAGDGRLQEFQQPIRARHVLHNHPSTFLCSSDTMFVDCFVPHVPGDEELQIGQIYFLMPFTKSNKPLSLQELCSLVVKACSALQTES
ncbi:hypothetical protein CTI12_AA101380 [Artemisia annua]|uniref:Uncharacterized protein n=1 Tax=Artemisia annua TaxID=35608 RepID=A0A2U1N3C2_ARTAN|nr:hypothetical protein CTI12_AA101380 [Artemisia annua]